MVSALYLSSVEVPVRQRHRSVRADVAQGEHEPGVVSADEHGLPEQQLRPVLSALKPVTGQHQVPEVFDKAGGFVFCVHVGILDSRLAS